MVKMLCSEKILVIFFAVSFSLYGESVYPKVVSSNREYEEHKSFEYEIEEVLDKMDLTEAIMITLQNQLDIQISQMEVAEKSGIVQSSAGPFDPLVEGNVNHLIKEDRQYFPSGIRTHLPAHETTGTAGSISSRE